VSPGWRVGLFMALGLLMLIVAVAYGKLVRLLDPAVEAGDGAEVSSPGDPSVPE
jgi:hypothetical protein